MYACIGERGGERVKLLQMPIYLLKEHHLRLPCHSRTITITHLPYTHALTRFHDQWMCTLLADEEVPLVCCCAISLSFNGFYDDVLARADACHVSAVIDEKWHDLTILRLRICYIKMILCGFSIWTCSSLLYSAGGRATSPGRLLRWNVFSSLVCSEAHPALRVKNYVSVCLSDVSAGVPV